MECDYYARLSQDDRAWLYAFNEEYIHASFSHKKARRSKKWRKSCYSANNSRNRDLYNYLKLTGNLDMRLTPEYIERNLEHKHIWLYEDMLIHCIDKYTKKILKK